MAYSSARKIAGSLGKGGELGILSLRVNSLQAHADVRGFKSTVSKSRLSRLMQMQ